MGWLRSQTQAEATFGSLVPGQRFLTSTSTGARTTFATMGMGGGGYPYDIKNHARERKWTATLDNPSRYRQKML